MKHVKDIIFFNDYGLWAKLSKQARIEKKSIQTLIVEMVEKFSQKNGSPKIEINYDEELHGACETLSSTYGMTIPGFIEAVCNEAITGTPIVQKAKGGFFNLDRDLPKMKGVEARD